MHADTMCKQCRLMQRQVYSFESLAIHSWRQCHEYGIAPITCELKCPSIELQRDCHCHHGQLCTHVSAYPSALPITMSPVPQGGPHTPASQAGHGSSDAGLVVGASAVE
eukprot:6239482-Amphidinium_carterae.1